MKQASLVCCALLAAGCHSASAPPSDARSLALSTEQQVNTYTAGDQQMPKVARNAAGDGVVVWDSFGEDGSHFGVFGQRYKHGNRVGQPFRANTHVTNRQNFATVAIDGTGNFVVAWRSSRQGSDGGTIFAQRFLADGSPVGGEFQVGPDNSEFDSQSEPSAAMNARGDFVIAWSSRELNGAVAAAGVTNVETRRIQARAYAADGTARTDILNVIPAELLSVIRSPAVAMDGESNFAVCWVADGNANAIRARRFSADGMAQGAAVNVNDARTDAEFDRPAIAMNDAGDYVVAWESSFLGSGVPDSIYFKRYSLSSETFGAERRAGMPGKAEASVLAQRAAVALNRRGDVIVAAHGDDVIYVQRFDAGDGAGLPQAVSSSGFPSLFPAIAIGDDGDALLAWHSFRQDGDGRGIFLRELRLPHS